MRANRVSSKAASLNLRLFGARQIFDRNLEWVVASGAIAKSAIAVESSIGIVTESPRVGTTPTLGHPPRAEIEQKTPESPSTRE
jgi:hypothetical protein